VSDELDALAGQLTERLARLGGALVTFSGGVVSSLAAALAARALGEQALAVTAVSPALASGELDGARSVARAVDVRYELISRPSWSVAAETDTRPPPDASGQADSGRWRAPGTADS
jgi:PP-loop superfamily ATP-utilizing enzyme